MLLFVALALGALMPGVFVAWRVRPRHGWVRAILAGTAVVLGVTGFALVSLIALAPLAIALTTASAVAALHAYDRGRLVLATLWVSTMAVCLWCAGWTQ